jgi:hypothetical protein
MTDLNCAWITSKVIGINKVSIATLALTISMCGFKQVARRTVCTLDTEIEVAIIVTRNVTQNARTTLLAVVTSDR